MLTRKTADQRNLQTLRESHSSRGDHPSGSANDTVRGRGRAATVRPTGAGLRRGVDLSQEELAERAGLHRNYIGGVERGERNVALLNIGRLAKALGVSLSELFVGLRTAPKRRI